LGASHNRYCPVGMQPAEAITAEVRFVQIRGCM
jgi:hypothetical protein